jgi:hypothetical protein
VLASYTMHPAIVTPCLHCGHTDRPHDGKATTIKAHVPVYPLPYVISPHVVRCGSVEKEAAETGGVSPISAAGGTHTPLVGPSSGVRMRPAYQVWSRDTTPGCDNSGGRGEDRLGARVRREDSDVPHFPPAQYPCTPCTQLLDAASIMDAARRGRNDAHSSVLLVNP